MSSRMQKTRDSQENLPNGKVNQYRKKINNLKKYLVELDDKKYTPVKKKMNESFDEYSAKQSAKKNRDFSSSLHDRKQVQSFMTQQMIQRKQTSSILL